MSFSSPLFLLVFLPLALFGFHLIRGADSGRLRSYWLLSASLLFYACSGPADSLLLAASLLGNYAAGRALIERRLQGRTSSALVSASVIANVAILFAYKTLASVHGGAGFLSAASILIPLGLSFITFQQIAFINDCHRGRIRHVTPRDYVLFITFFPQLVMGPIVHFRQIAPQFSAESLSLRSMENLTVGFAIFSFGLFKKLVVADSLAPSVDRVFIAADQGQALSMIDAWGGAIGFQLQLFMDFSGYADMAIGLARMFNINLPINYDNPYHSTSRFDLWRRWHITFVEFMRSHVFQPLARISWMPTWGALAITCMASGLWHGLGWTFVVWGGVQTALLLLSHGWTRWRRGNLASRLPRLPLAQIAITFLVTVVVGVMFRAPSLAGSCEIYRGLLAFDRPILPASLALPLSHWGWSTPMEEHASLLFAYLDLVPFGIAAALIWWIPQTSALFARYWTAIDPRPAAHRPQKTGPQWLAFRLSWRWGLLTGLWLLTALLCLDQSRRFVYFQF